MSMMVSYFVLSFFPRDVLDEIWDRTESVPENFPTYSRVTWHWLPKTDACLDIKTQCIRRSALFAILSFEVETVMLFLYALKITQCKTLINCCAICNFKNFVFLK